MKRDRTIIYGLGEHFQSFPPVWLSEDYLGDVVAYADRDPGKHGSELNQRPVIAPAQLSAYNCDKVIIATDYFLFREIADTFIYDYGFPEHKIDWIDHYVFVSICNQVNGDCFHTDDPLKMDAYKVVAILQRIKAQYNYSSP